MGSVDPESKVLCTGREVRLAGLDESLLPETLMMDMKKGEAAMVRIYGAEKLPRVKSQERSVAILGVPEISGGEEIGRLDRNGSCKLSH